MPSSQLERISYFNYPFTTMAVRIVTDSVADIPSEIIDELKISVVPLIVRFGDQEYIDGINISPEVFYEKLRTDPHFPTTSAPSAQMFADVFDAVAEEADEILVVSVSSSLSGTYQAAVAARELMRSDVSVAVFDSRLAAMAEGFIAIRAARAAANGGSMREITEIANDAAERSRFLCTFQTLEYLKKGGRIGAAQAFLGSILKIKPLISLGDGVVQPAGKVRTRQQAVDRLVGFAASYSKIDELGVEYTACVDEAEDLVNCLSKFHPVNRIHLSGMTPVIGSHTGPGLLLVAVCGDR